MLHQYLALIDTEAERERFTELYHEHQNYMFCVAMKILHDEKLAEDAVHDAFMSAAKKISKIMKMSCNESRDYLIIIVRNAAFRIYNKNKRELPSEEITEPSPEHHSVQSEVEQRNMHKRMMEIIRGMNPNYGDVLMLRYYHGMNNSEIAEALGITPQNVRVRLHRGKELLREELERDDLYDGATV